MTRAKHSLFASIGTPLLKRCVPVLAVGILCLPGLLLAAIEVEINGVDDKVANNVRLHLGDWRELPGADAAAIGEEINSDVIRALQAMGYYRSEIEYRLDGETVVISIETGEPIVWDSADIQILRRGEPAQDFSEIENAHPFTKGEALNHKDYENYKRRLLNLANDLGYLDTQIQKSQLRINPESGLANVILTIDVGERYRVGNISVTDTEISTQLTDIITEIKEGDWFSANSVGEVYNNLLNSGYFSAVNIVTEKQPPSTANLNIQVQDAAEHRVTTGVGYGTDTGARFTLTWSRPHTNSRGNSQHNELLVSEVEQSVTSRYRIPWQHPQNRYLSWDSGYRHKLVEDTLTKVATTGLVFHLLRDNGWQYSAGVNLENERSELNDETETDVTYVIPSANASRRNVWGEPNDPRFAYKYWVNVAHSTETLGSDTNFTKLNVGANTLLSIGEKSSIVARVDVGGISADEFLDVPLSQRFFTGGDQSVRGYQFERISPLDEEGELLGGQYFSTGSLEYRYRWAPSWQAALFVDGGRSYLGNETPCPGCEDRGEEYRTSAGFGVRWLSPVGFIAVDIAFPLNAVGAQEEPDGPRLHLYLGTQL
jgi:translocation and assembly module TamA